MEKTAVHTGDNAKTNPKVLTHLATLKPSTF